MAVGDMDLAGDVSGFTSSSTSLSTESVWLLGNAAGRLGYSVFGFAVLLTDSPAAST